MNQDPSDKLKPGECCVIREYCNCTSDTNRLMEMGLLEGTPVSWIKFAPWAILWKFVSGLQPFDPERRSPPPILLKRDSAIDVCKCWKPDGTPVIFHKNSGLLCGQPKHRQTSVFNALTGLRQKWVIIPALRLKKSGMLISPGGAKVEVIDLPGLYSLNPQSLDEEIAVETLYSDDAIDLIVAVADASNLNRNLYLVSQLLELNKPTLLALNMVDVAKAHGIEINIDELAASLAVTVIPVIGSKGKAFPNYGAQFLTFLNRRSKQSIAPAMVERSCTGNILPTLYRWNCWKYWTYKFGSAVAAAAHIPRSENLSKNARIVKWQIILQITQNWTALFMINMTNGSNWKPKSAIVGWIAFATRSYVV